MNVERLNASASTAVGPSGAGQGLDKDAFMDLLLLQIRSQDPMNPMDSSQMFNQMAQLSMLEQLWDIREAVTETSTTQQLAEGSMLIGRHVEASSATAGRISGLVEQVKMVSGAVWLQVGADQIRLDEVTSVQ